MKRFHFLSVSLFWGLWMISVIPFAQEPVKKAEWFPPGHLYPVIRLDYQAPQISGGLYAFYASSRWQNRLFAIFSMGIDQGVVRWNKSGSKASELAVSVSVFPQFVFNKPLEEFQTNFFNIDYFVGLEYTWKQNPWHFRGRIYHISSHLGDEYILRTGIGRFQDNNRIYEAIDFSATWNHTIWLLYGTVGVIYHAAYPRNPLLLQTGFQTQKRWGNSAWIGWTTGMDIRMEQEQDFRPGIHAGAGIVLGEGKPRSATIMIDYYNGYIPYSLYDNLLIQWLGASLYISLF